MYSGIRLRTLREERNHTRESLSLEIGISTAQIVRHEQDKIPSGADLLKYAEFFGVSTDFLLGISDDPTPEIGESNLNPHEREVISLWRQGKQNQAAAIILTSD